MDDLIRYCDFCGKSSKDAGSLVEATGSPNNSREDVGPVYICEHCAENSKNLLEFEHSALPRKPLKVPNPQEIVKYLDQYVIGQDFAKKILSVSVANHFKRLLIGDKNWEQNEDLIDVEVDKSNVLLIGPTGSGKTFLASTLARFLDVPFAIGDATTLTEAGYVGEDVENLLLKLLHAADYNIEEAERGILYIDEIDKIGSTHNNVSITRDVSGEGVQQSLLKMLEGTIANIPPQGGRKHPEQEYIKMDTKNILFICGGTFVGLEDIVEKRQGTQKIGFGTPGKKGNRSLKNVTEGDLREFGLIPELIGRLPIIGVLEELDEDSLYKVLTEPKNALIRQYQKLFAFDNAKLRYTPEAIREIAKIAKEKNTGARALRSVVEKLMLDVMYDLPSQPPGNTYTLTEKFVRGEESLFKKAA